MDMKKNTIKGFTLLEMMIVLAIIGIMIAIALPSYQRYILRSHRVDARNTLQVAAQRLEQNFSANRTYACTENKKKANCTKKINNDWLEEQGVKVSPVNGTTRYNISFVNEPEDRRYQLQAVPTGAQTRDECGTFILDQSGVRQVQKEGGMVTDKVNATSEGRKLAAKCWSS